MQKWSCGVELQRQLNKLSRVVLFRDALQEIFNCNCLLICRDLRQLDKGRKEGRLWSFHSPVFSFCSFLDQNILEKCWISKSAQTITQQHHHRHVLLWFHVISSSFISLFPPPLEHWFGSKHMWRLVDLIILFWPCGFSCLLLLPPSSGLLRLAFAPGVMGGWMAAKGLTASGQCWRTTAVQRTRPTANTENYSQEKNKCSLNGAALKIHRISALVIAAQLFRIITWMLLCELTEFSDY